MAKNEKKKGPDKPIMEGTDFEYGGKNYRFRVGSFIVTDFNNNLPITAAEAKASPEVLKYLVESGSAIVEEAV